MAMAGELMVLAASALWITAWKGTGWLFAAGVVLFAIGRLAGAQGDAARSQDYNLSLTVRRLYRQRMTGVFVLMLSAILINLHQGFYAFGVYLRPSVWLIPFVVFVIIEVYTAFRIPVAEKNNENRKSLNRK